jgi:hypothetical protein
MTQETDSCGGKLAALRPPQSVRRLLHGIVGLMIALCMMTGLFQLPLPLHALVGTGDILGTVPSPTPWELGLESTFAPAIAR